MAITLELEDLLTYTDWQRSLWLALLRKQQSDVLKIPSGPHGDGRLNTIGEIVRHIFSAERRYIERLSNEPLTDTSVIPADDLEALFVFGAQSRAAFRSFLSHFPDEKLDVLQQHNIAGHALRLTPRKILVHIAMHEVRHWAQIATLLRLQGVKIGFQDFLFSPVFMHDEEKSTSA